MTREARLLLIVSATAVVGLLGLLFLSQRYTRILAQRTDKPPPLASSSAPGIAPGVRGVSAPESADEQVRAFLAVRRAVRQELDNSGPEGPPELERLQRLARESMARHGLDDLSYRNLRERYLQWVASEVESTAQASVAHSEDPLVGAFRAHAAELAEADLGVYAGQL